MRFTPKCPCVLSCILSIGVLASSASAVSPEKSDGEATAKADSTPKSVSELPLKRISAAAGKVDEFIEAGYAKHNVKPNPLASDEVFLRRVYLDIIGRIPSLDEATAFLNSKDSSRRSKLIDQLLDSEGYVSHHFNYWADLLRIQTRMRYAPARPYIDFVKQSLRDNKPYDQFVRELITAEGYTWDNGAAGYYLRDTGMPLDHMSNTIQVFLGTQLVCAQCHNHPYDTWTQKQYYQLAAFSYGVQTRDRSLPQFRELQRMRRAGEMERRTLQMANRILRPLAYRAHETDRSLRLPQDYQYKDAKPRSPIDPKTIFGEDVEVPEGASRKEIYAGWMTSPKNPRFTTVIANRLWKRAMGVGLIEPVDDFKGGVDSMNTPLMSFLVKQMVDLKYDLKQFQRVLFNTKTYQREVSRDEIAEDQPYHFPGPVLRRLSAEQIWDSMVTIVIPQVDQRKGLTRNYNRYANGKQLVDKDLKEILVMAEQQAEVFTKQYKFREMTGDLQRKLRIASRTNDRDKVNELRAKMTDIRREIYGKEGEMRMQRQMAQYREQRRETDPRWVGFSRELVRASEIDSPARPGHFLRQFGQSDRETIENANTEATVPQMLTLLNGPMFYQMQNRNSVLAKNLAKAADAEERLDVLFISTLGRRPTEREKMLTLAEVESGPKGMMDVLWALLNTRQFMFVQ